jgi:hypothetical protein
MPARELQERLNSLREQLDRNVPLSEEELAALHEEARQIEAQLKLEETTPDNNLVDGHRTLRGRSSRPHRHPAQHCQLAAQHGDLK